MCVMNALHKHALTRQHPNIWMMIPERVLVITTVACMSEFLKRRIVTFAL